MKESEPYPVVAVGFENFQTRLSYAAVLEDHSMLFCLTQERNIRTDGILLALNKTGGKGYRKQQENTMPELSSHMVVSDRT